MFTMSTCKCPSTKYRRHNTSSSIPQCRAHGREIKKCSILAATKFDRTSAIRRKRERKKALEEDSQFFFDDVHTPEPVDGGAPLQTKARAGPPENETARRILATSTSPSQPHKTLSSREKKSAAGMPERRESAEGTLALARRLLESAAIPRK